MLELSRGYVAYLLSGFGEPEVAASIVKASDDEFRRVNEAANRGAHDGKEWLKVACRAAIEVVEGESRELRRTQLAEKDMPQELLAEDRQVSAARSRAFSSGAPVKKREILAALSAAITPELPGYKYFKSRAQFTKPSTEGMSYVSLHRGRGIAYLSFGVTHAAIVGIEQSLFGPRSVVAQRVEYPQTLLVLSMNISPRSHYWPHVIDASWLILGEDGIRLASSEAGTFVREVVVPFIVHNRTPERIRDTLLSIPGQIASMRSAQTVFAIDHLERRRDWLDADLAVFEERYSGYSQENREKLQCEYRRAVECWDRGN